MPGKRARPVRRETTQKRTSHGWHLAAWSTLPSRPRTKPAWTHYQVRRYDAWYRHITLSMLAHAYLASTAASCRPTNPPSTVLPPKKGIRHLWTTRSHSH